MAAYDIDELVLQLHEELKLAFHLARVDVLSNAFRIESVKAKMGRRDINKEVNASNLNVLNPARYPKDEDWEIEVIYANEEAIVKNQKTLVNPKGCLLSDKLKHLPLSSLKGISSVWQNIFADKNISTLGELSDFPEEEISKLCSDENSFFPQEFQTKVRLLKQPGLQKKISNANQLFLKDLALKTENELKKILGKNFTVIEIRIIKSLINLLMLTIDKNVFCAFKFELLLCNE